MNKSNVIILNKVILYNFTDYVIVNINNFVSM